MALGGSGAVLFPHLFQLNLFLSEFASSRGIVFVKEVPYDCRNKLNFSECNQQATHGMFFFSDLPIELNHQNQINFGFRCSRNNVPLEMNVLRPSTPSPAYVKVAEYLKLSLLAERKNVPLLSSAVLAMTNQL